MKEYVGRREGGKEKGNKGGGWEQRYRNVTKSFTFFVNEAFKTHLVKICVLYLPLFYTGFYTDLQ